MMLTRRLFGMLVLAAPLAIAGTPRPVVWSGTRIAKPEAGSIVIAGTHIRLHNRATPREIVMLSHTNDNAQFTLWLVLPKQGENDFQYLNLGGAWWSSRGSGYDQGGTQTTFQLDRADARRVAEAFRIPIHERTAQGGRLHYTWRIPPKASLDPTVAIPVVLRVENRGTATVGFMMGGRQRGPRDNRFAFTITRNGKPVAIKDAPDFGGVGGYAKLEPGKSLEVTCADLRAWAALAEPGYYTIEARYEGELAQDGEMPRTAADRAKLWDIAIPGQGAILVQ